MENQKLTTLCTETKQLWEDGYQLVNQLKQNLLDILKEYGKPIEWEYNSSFCPQMVSRNFDDDVTDCNITKIWVDDNNILVNLYAYYIADDRENIDLNDEVMTMDEYVDILDYVIQHIEKENN